MGPHFDTVDSPMGRRPPVAGPHEFSGRSSHDEGALLIKTSIILDVFTPFHLPEVVISPTPTFTRPSPRGNIQA